MLYADPSNTNSLTRRERHRHLGSRQHHTYNDGTVTNSLMFANFQTLNGGTVGDTFNVTVTTSGFPLTLNGNGGGGDTFNVGFDGTSDPNDENLTGSLANVQDTVTINGIGATLNVSDAADTNAIALTITASDIQSGNAGDIIYNGPSTINTSRRPHHQPKRDRHRKPVSGTTLTLTSQGTATSSSPRWGRTSTAPSRGSTSSWSAQAATR